MSVDGKWRCRSIERIEACNNAEVSARAHHRARHYVQQANRWASHREPAPQLPGEPIHPGLLAQIWATLKLGLAGLISPLWAPAIMFRANVNNRRAQQLTIDFPAQVRRIANGETPTLLGNTVAELPAEIRLAIISDQHRGIAGRLDWQRRQRTEPIVQALLEHYADGEWHLCENGDIEDFWSVGGSTSGAIYDMLRILGALLDRIGQPALSIETARYQLNAIIANHFEIYRVIRDEFVAKGRYVRTIGNHDNVIRRPMVAEQLRAHLGVHPIADFVALRSGDQLVALVAHGHHTDGWNAPFRDNLGKLSSWMASTLIDVPRLDSPEGLPPQAATTVILEGRLPNKLITINPIFGANSSYDSLDEELLANSIAAAGLDHIWYLLGHTHSPVEAPVMSRGIKWKRYANSGSGLVQDVVTAIEWDGTVENPTARVVAWTLDSLGVAQRIELFTESAPEPDRPEPGIEQPVGN